MKILLKLRIYLINNFSNLKYNGNKVLLEVLKIRILINLKHFKMRGMI